jgi:cytochrome c-type biogenesis protein CcmH
LIAQLEQEMPATRRAELLSRLQPMLEAQVRRADPDGDYRFLLARLYTAEERYPEAAALYAELVDLYPEDAAIIAQSAQALYLAGGRKLTPAVQALVDRAFAIDPAQVTLLGLVGMDRFQAGDYRGALDYWQKLLDHLPPGAPDAGVIRDGIAMARARLGESSGPAPGAPVADSGAPPAAAGPRLQVTVSLAPGLELRPGDTVFVFARAVGGPPMPLAVARFPATELPRAVELSDAMAMAPGMKLSSFAQVSVIARISRQGGVSAQPGDLEGGGEPLTLTGGEQSIQVLIDRTI